ncbi:hypothetical protein AURDEDRAFT_130285 [Auricularia subglabra TFB-10046 SS5]|nr:hypothetical protein AURDEDRAFT_130285 [Auricularia subglabra TFB-10046 SS5]
MPIGRTLTLVEARRLNASQPINRTPHDVFFVTMSHLNILDRFSSALVCTVWRTHLLKMPLLWNNIVLCLRERAKVDVLPDVLEVLLARSGDYPLTIQLSLEGEDPRPLSREPASDRGLRPVKKYERAIPRLLIANMKRMRSLSLRLWYWSRSDWVRLFTTPAPILERFHLTLFNDDPRPLPSRLFDDRACRLRTIYLDWVYLPANPGLVLDRVQSLYYACPVAVESRPRTLEMIPRLTGLRCLTVGSRMDDDVLSRWAALQGAPLDRLQLWNDDSELIPRFLGLVGNVGHICYSLALMHSDWHARTGTSMVLTHVRLLAANILRSIEVGPRRYLLPEMGGTEDRIEEDFTFALRFDGQDVVVDIFEDELEEFLNNVPLALISIVNGIQRLAIPATLWDMFDRSCLLTLAELTLYISVRDDWATEEFMPVPSARSRKHNVSLLRLVCFGYDPEHLASTPPIAPLEEISLAPVTRFISGSIASGVLQRIVLDGFTFSLEELGTLRSIVPNLAFETSTGYLREDACAPWKWFFPQDEAFPV